MWLLSFAGVSDVDVSDVALRGGLSAGTQTGRGGDETPQICQIFGKKRILFDDSEIVFFGVLKRKFA